MLSMGTHSNMSSAFTNANKYKRDGPSDCRDHQMRLRRSGFVASAAGRIKGVVAFFLDLFGPSMLWVHPRESRVAISSHSVKSSAATPFLTAKINLQEINGDRKCVAGYG